LHGHLKECQIDLRVARGRRERAGIGWPHQLQQLMQLGCAIGTCCEMRSDARSMRRSIYADCERSSIRRQLFAE
jgi:hypothetical protein